MKLADHTTAWMMTYAMVHPTRMWMGLNDVVKRDLTPAQWQALFMLYYEKDPLDSLYLSFEADASAWNALQGLEFQGLVSFVSNKPTGCSVTMAEEGLALMDEAGAALLGVCMVVEQGNKGTAYDPNQ